MPSRPPARQQVVLRLDGDTATHLREMERERRLRTGEAASLPQFVRELVELVVTEDRRAHETGRSRAREKSPA